MKKPLPVRRVVAWCVTAVMIAGLSSAACAEEDIGLVQKLFRKFSGKPQKPAVVQPVTGSPAVNPQGDVVPVPKTDEPVAGTPAPATASAVEGQALLTEHPQSGNLPTAGINFEREGLSEAEKQGLTPEEQEEAEELKEQLKDQKQERENLMIIRRAHDAQQKIQYPERPPR